MISWLAVSYTKKVSEQLFWDGHCSEQPLWVGVQQSAALCLGWDALIFADESGLLEKPTLYIRDDETSSFSCEKLRGRPAANLIDKKTQTQTVIN